MFINQAYKGDNTWWRVLITTLLTTGIFIANFIMFFLMSKEQMDEVYKKMGLENIIQIDGLIEELHMII